MVFSLVVLILSVALVFLIEKKNLLSIWFLPFLTRLKELFTGILLAALLCFFTQTILAQIASIGWNVSDNVTVNKIFSSALYDFKSILFEEVLFRGVLLYFLIKYLGNKGVLISAVAFGIYHWFSYQVFGNPIVMAWVFITTGFMGYAFAYAYRKTNSLILPIGLHFGWNFLNNTIYSNGPLGEMLLVANKDTEFTDLYSLVSFLLYLIVPTIIVLIIKYSHKERRVDKVA